MLFLFGSAFALSFHDSYTLSSLDDLASLEDLITKNKKPSKLVKPPMSRSTDKNLQTKIYTQRSADKDLLTKICRQRSTDKDLYTKLYKRKSTPTVLPTNLKRREILTLKKYSQ